MVGTKKGMAVLMSSAILAAGLVVFALGSWFPAAFAATFAAAPPLNLKTDNGSVKVVVDWPSKELQLGKAVEFSINFQDPSSGNLLQHVNYNLEVKDASGNTVESLADQHSHTGKATQTMMFDNAGNYQLVITVLGTGLTMPFDTSNSGTAEAPIEVEGSS